MAATETSQRVVACWASRQGGGAAYWQQRARLHPSSRQLNIARVEPHCFRSVTSLLLLSSACLCLHGHAAATLPILPLPPTLPCLGVPVSHAVAISFLQPTDRNLKHNLATGQGTLATLLRADPHPLSPSLMFLIGLACRPPRYLLAISAFVIDL